MGKAVRYSASVVGAGTGGELSMSALMASDRFELVAAADLREDVRRRLADRYPGTTTYEDYQEMLDE